MVESLLSGMGGKAQNTVINLGVYATASATVGFAMDWFFLCRLK